MMLYGPKNWFIVGFVNFILRLAIVETDADLTS